MARRMYDLDNGTEDIKVKSVKSNVIYSIDEEMSFISESFGSLVIDDTGFNFNTPSGVHLYDTNFYFSPYTTALRPTFKSEGAVIYDSTLKKCILYNGSAWVNLDGSSLGE